MGKGRISTAVVSSLLLAQSLPFISQTMPPVIIHTDVWTPPTVPVHQYTGTVNTFNLGANYHAGQ